ncbi:hypothetical protein HanIR_Chr07g0301721 [Helianthus annuus]|nr:hypothetical protein HanIR_Chr07g0301721 [Helianthus annuus]
MLAIRHDHRIPCHLIFVPTHMLKNTFSLTQQPILTIVTNKTIINRTIRDKPTRNRQLMKLTNQFNILTSCSNSSRECKPIHIKPKLTHFNKQVDRRPGFTAVSIGCNKGVVRHDIWLGNLVEQLVGNVGLGLFSVG